jgi:hypothetical protein
MKSFSKPVSCSLLFLSLSSCDISPVSVLSAAREKKETVPPEPSTGGSSSLGIQIDITQQYSGDSCDQDVAISSPDLKQLSEEQRQQELKNREIALLQRQEELRKAEEERLQKEREVEAKYLPSFPPSSSLLCL